VVFDALDDAPDELAMRAEAVRGMLEARTAFLASGCPLDASTALAAVSDCPDDERSSAGLVSLTLER